jgi:hypothetical protein
MPKPTLKQMVEELRNASYICAEDESVRSKLEYWGELVFFDGFFRSASKEFFTAWKKEISVQYQILKEKFDITEKTEEIKIKLKRKVAPILRRLPIKNPIY